MGWIRSLFGRSPAAPVEVVLYTRPGCGLCEEMKEAMRSAGVEGHYVLREIDIDGERALKKRYGLRIPVLDVAGVEAFEGRLEPAAFRAEVRKASRRTS